MCHSLWSCLSSPLDKIHVSLRFWRLGCKPELCCDITQQFLMIIFLTNVVIYKLVCHEVRPVSQDLKLSL